MRGWVARASLGDRDALSMINGPAASNGPLGMTNDNYSVDFKNVVVVATLHTRMSYVDRSYTDRK